MLGVILILTHFWTRHLGAQFAAVGFPHVCLPLSSPCSRLGHRHEPDQVGSPIMFCNTILRKKIRLLLAAEMLKPLTPSMGGDERGVAEHFPHLVIVQNKVNYWWPWLPTRYDHESKSEPKGGVYGHGTFTDTSAGGILLSGAQQIQASMEDGGWIHWRKRKWTAASLGLCCRYGGREGGGLGKEACARSGVMNL